MRLGKELQRAGTGVELSDETNKNFDIIPAEIAITLRKELGQNSRLPTTRDC